MKALLTVLSATALLSTVIFAEPAMMKTQKSQMDQGKMQSKQKMMNTPEKVSQEMGSQEKGMGYGQGQGMMQGKQNKKDKNGGMGPGMGGGMGGGKGGR